MSRAYVDVEVSFSVLFPGVRFAQMDLIGSFLNGIERNRQTETRLKTGKTCKGDKRKSRTHHYDRSLCPLCSCWTPNPEKIAIRWVLVKAPKLLLLCIRRRVHQHQSRPKPATTLMLPLPDRSVRIYKTVLLLRNCVFQAFFAPSFFVFHRLSTPRDECEVSRR
jgi:hypothetical protein